MMSYIAPENILMAICNQIKYVKVAYSSSMPHRHIFQLIGETQSQPHHLISVIFIILKTYDRGWRF